jgi:hypothetical protein
MSKEKVSFTYQDVFPETNSECNRQNDVFRYFENLLPQDEARSFEEHLTDCFHCAGLLADLDDTNRAADATMIDAGKADQIFSQTRARLEDRLGVRSRTPLHIPPPAKSFHIPAYMNLLLIGLVAALIYPSYKSFVLNNEVTELKKELSAEKSKSVGVSQQQVDALKQNYEKQIQSLNEERSQMSQPDLSGSAVYAVRTERSASNETINVSFGTQQTFNVVFSVPADFKIYAVEILDDGNQIWQRGITVQPQADSPSALISINLKADYFKDGVYRLKISGLDKQNNSTQLDEFKLKVSHLVLVR